MKMLGSWHEHDPEKLAPPPERVLRNRENKSPQSVALMSVTDLLRLDLNTIVSKLWNGQLADIDDIDTLTCLIDSAGDNIDTLKDMMLQVINSVPASNQTDHFWAGKETYVFIERLNQHRWPP